MPLGALSNFAFEGDALKLAADEIDDDTTDFENTVIDIDHFRHCKFSMVRKFMDEHKVPPIPDRFG